MMYLMSVIGFGDGDDLLIRMPPLLPRPGHASPYCFCAPVGDTLRVGAKNEVGPSKFLVAVDLKVVPE